MRWTSVWIGNPPALLVKLAVLLVGGIVTVLDGREFWSESWKAALDWGTVSTALIGPLAAGLAAAAYVRIVRTGARDQLDGSPRPVLAWTLPAVCIWVLATLAMVAVTLGLTTIAGLSGLRSYPRYFWVVPATAFVLLAQVAIGAALGARIARPWIAPVAVIVVFGIGVLGAVGLFAPVFDTGGVTSLLAGEGFSARFIWLQALVCCGLAVVAALIAAPRLWHTGWATRGIAVALVAAGCAAYVGLGATHGDRYVGAPSEWVCSGTAVRICAAAETTRSLTDLVRAFDTQIAVIDRLGIAHPSRWEESLPTAPPSPTSGVLDPLAVDQPSSRSGAAGVAESIATPAPCARYADPAGPPIRALDARHLVADYVLNEVGSYRPGAHAPDAAWLAAPAREKAAWVRSAYRLLSACQLDALRLPHGLRVR